MDGNNDSNNNNNDNTVRIQENRIQENLGQITQAASQAAINGQELCRHIWNFMTNFSDESISQFEGRKLLASDLIVEALERGAENSTANRDLFDIRRILMHVFRTFFDNLPLRANELPFFTTKLKTEEKQTLRNGRPQVANRNGQRPGQPAMSGAVTTLTNYDSIKEMYHGFNTSFETFDPNYTEEDRDIFQDGNVNRENLYRLFSISFGNNVSNTERVNEGAQMAILAERINPMLQELEMEMVVPANSKPDLKVVNSRNPDQTIFIGEAKSTEKLPLTPSTAELSKQLLDHGFATAIARVIYEVEGEQDLNDLARNLRGRLGVTDDNLPNTQIPEGRLSTRARDILTNLNVPELNESYNGVIQALGAGQINAKNALHLWDATMQACVKSIELKIKFTTVQSDKVLYLVHLRDPTDRGIIGISKGFAVGSKTFIRDFIRYAAMVRRGSTGGERIAVMADNVEQGWRHHLAMNEQDQGGGGGRGRGRGRRRDRGGDSERNEGNTHHSSGKRPRLQRNITSSHHLAGNSGVLKTMHQHEENKWKSNDGLDGSVKSTDATEIMSDIVDTGSASYAGSPESLKKRSQSSGGGSPSSNNGPSTKYILLDDNDHNQNRNIDRPHLKDEHDVCGSKKAETVNSHNISMMTDQEQMRWQRALWCPARRNVGTTKKDLRRGTSPTTAPTAGNSQLLKGAMIDAATTNESYDSNDNDNDNTASTDNGADTSWSLTKAEQDALLDIDEYGNVPFISQLEEVLCHLGFQGRCGQVKKIKFFGIEVAMKEFKLQHDDDERDYYDVFKHEREMYIRTKSLWGTHVPALIFHNPWPSCPSLGIQLGEPMEEDDVEKWSDEDKEKRRETLRKLKELGLEQTDKRGWNFVKLRKGDTEYVAVIDMESVKPIYKRR